MKAVAAVIAVIDIRRKPGIRANIGHIPNRIEFGASLNDTAQPRAL